MDPVLEPQMAVSVPGQVTGTQVIDSLCALIAEKLSRDCSLRGMDVYRGFTAKAEITLQLLDVYPVEVSAQMNVGEIDPKLPAKHVSLGSEVTAVEPEWSNLERPVDSAGVAEIEPEQKRLYVSRLRTPR